MCILHRSGHPNGSGPIVVHVGELVGQFLNLGWAKLGSLVASNLLEHNEMRRRDGALIHCLGNQKEVLVPVAGDGVVQHCSRHWVHQINLKRRNQ